MSDFKLDATGDLDLSSGGMEIVEGEDAIVQELRIRAHQVQGNWFLDLNEGLPYFSRIFINGPNEADVYSIYANEFLQVENVVEINSLQITAPSPDSWDIITSLLSTEGPISDLQISAL